MENTTVIKNNKRNKLRAIGLQGFEIFRSVSSIKGVVFQYVTNIFELR
jgi:hypothetical protein